MIQSLIIKSKRFGDREILFDECDYDLINDRKWSLSGPHKSNKCYPVTYNSIKGGKKIKFIKMHRLILGVTDPKVIIDHKNGNGCDNRRSNIRIATHSQNSANASIATSKIVPYKGVSTYRYKDRISFTSRITVDHKTIALGYYRNPEDAALAYNKAAIKYYGDFAKLNQV